MQYRFFKFSGGGPPDPLQKLARFARWLPVCPSTTSLWVDMNVPLTCEKHPPTKYSGYATVSSSRLRLWKDSLTDVPASVKMGLVVAESLPAGSGEDYLCWRVLNRLRTGVGRAKTVMMRWGYLDDTQSVDCDWGSHRRWSTSSPAVYSLIDEACRADDLAAVTERAKVCARKWEKIVWRTRQEKMRKYHRLYWLMHSCQLCLMQLKGILFNFIVMYPPDKRPRLYASGATKKTREESSTGQCGGRHEYNPEHFCNHHSERRRNFRGQSRKQKGDAVDVIPSVPAPEDEAAAEPTTAEPATAEPTTTELTTAEPARRGPVVQELDLTLDNPTDVGLSSVRPDRGPKWDIVYGPPSASRILDKLKTTSHPVYCTWSDNS